MGQYNPSSIQMDEHTNIPMPMEPLPYDGYCALLLVEFYFRASSDVKNKEQIVHKKNK